MVIHDRKRQRYRCKVCKHTFSARRGTMFEGLRKPMDLIVIVVTLLSYGCPIQAIVHAFGLDERTVAQWRDRGGTILNTAFIERLNGTFRERLASLTRKSRHAARRLQALETGMYLIGCTYTFCCIHHELSKISHIGSACTPAMAAGVTDHVWDIGELLSYRIPRDMQRDTSKQAEKRDVRIDIIQAWMCHTERVLRGELPHLRGWALFTPVRPRRSEREPL